MLSSVEKKKRYPHPYQSLIGHQEGYLCVHRGVSVIFPRLNVKSSNQRTGGSFCQLVEYKAVYAVRPSVQRVVREETHRPAKIYCYEVSIVERPNPASLDVYIYNRTLSRVLQWPKARIKLTFLMADERNLWMFHIDFSSKIHPTKAVDHFSLPVLGNLVCVTSHGELEGCVRDITGPFIVVSPDLFMYFFVRGARGVQLA